MNVSFATTRKILFGPGSLQLAAPEIARLGTRALLATGRHPRRIEPLLQCLEKAGLSWVVFTVAGEPKVTDAVRGAQLARDRHCDVVIGCGGGSALDAAKAVAALAVNTEPIESYLEVIGQGEPLARPPLPCVAVPTTAGTGSEVTANAVLHSEKHRVKVSLRNSMMLPDLAVVDPGLTLSLPPAVTAATGCDALTQLLEAFVSTKANPMTAPLCRDGLVRVARALPQAVACGEDLHARTDMSLASLFSGMALANGGLGAVHGIAGPLGGMLAAPHGALCARLLPLVTEANIHALRTEAPDSSALDRYTEAARLLTGSATADAAAVVAWLHRLIKTLDIPTLKHWGLTADQVDETVAKAQQASSMKGNPVLLSAAQLTEIIRNAMQ